MTRRERREHTPFPWRATEVVHHVTEHGPISDWSIVDSVGTVVAESCTEDDAILIAASPDLLVALAGCVRAIDRVVSDYAKRGTGERLLTSRAAADAAIATDNEARAALAKARGETDDSRV